MDKESLQELRAKRDAAAKAGDHGEALVLNDKVVRLKRKPRPLQKTYSPEQPYVVERHDQEDGSIHYEIMDERPESYRRLCSVCEDYNDDSEDGSPDRGQAKTDAELIVRALNLMHSYLPKSG